jgi:uncharacterized membrane protein YqaE (UPF0057 family)
MVARVSLLFAPKKEIGMSLGRVILCIILPPLAVIDKGCGSIVIVTLLTLIGWVPGVLGALIILNRVKPR